ncbi:MAG: ABC transporter permease [Chloroflexi bacterium]|nr:ABC transporter permease [Chloroflexota bacterium]
MTAAAGAARGAGAPLVRRRSWLERVGRLSRKYPMGAVSAVALVLLVGIAIFAGPVARADPYQVGLGGILERPSGAHWFGTDNFGRDAFARIVYGARVSLLVGTFSVAIGTGFGTVIGIISPVAGRWPDYVIQRFIDALFAFPPIILSIAIVSVLGAGVTQVTVAIGIVSIPRVARVVRSSTLGVLSLPYVEAARTIGARMPRIMFRHILPNVLAPVVILVSAGFATAILAEASLSFLGLGTPPPTPSWGQMLSGAAQQFVRQAPWMAVFPGLAITLAVLAFNLFGDAMRDALDPRLRGS